MVMITRRVEFDAGHRIPDHNSKCRNMHGHRYVLEATVTGELVIEGSSKGMVQDFGDLKAIMQGAVADPWDHAFLFFKDDTPVRAALEMMGPQHKHVALDFVPTVENLVEAAANALQMHMPTRVLLCAVRLYETPNCWADWQVPSSPFESETNLR